jgi:hypothetical protein
MLRFVAVPHELKMYVKRKYIEMHPSPPKSEIDHERMASQLKNGPEKHIFED